MARNCRLAYPDGQPKVTILNIKIPPKTRLATHKHPVSNAGVLLTGQLTVVSEANDTLRLKAGDTISELIAVGHQGVNKVDKSVEIVNF